MSDAFLIRIEKGNPRNEMQPHTKGRKGIISAYLKHRDSSAPVFCF